MSSRLRLIWAYWAVGFAASFVSPAISATMMGGMIYLIATYEQ